MGFRGRHFAGLRFGLDVQKTRRIVLSRQQVLILFLDFMIAGVLLFLLGFQRGVLLFQVCNFG